MWEIDRTMSTISRQQFLKLIAAGGASFLGLNPRLFGAEPARGPISPWGRLRFRCRGGDDDDWNVHPNGDLNLIDVMRSQSSANVGKRWNVADISNLETMSAFPFLFMHAERSPELEQSERANLREYLLRGGFLFAEDCVNGKGRSDGSGDEFFRRMAEVELPAILPGSKLERLPFDHPVFHCFHHIDGGIPHMQGKRHGLQGITLDGRLVALLSPSDTHCGWTNGDRWFGQGKQLQACKMGMNIYIYAMTGGDLASAGQLFPGADGTVSSGDQPA
jgi:hypothetical protein